MGLLMGLIEEHKVPIGEPIMDENRSIILNFG